MSYITVLAAAAITTGFITPIVIRLAYRFGLIDDPKTRFHPAHVHTGKIPRAGGLAIFLGSQIITVFFIGINKITAGLFIAALILTVVGLIDDKKDVHPYIRLSTNLIAALIIVLAGVGIPYVTNPLSADVIHLDSIKISFDLFGPHSIIVWSDVFALLWILWTVNIIGWSAGVDGQMPGFVTISALVLGALSTRYPAESLPFSQVTTLAMIIAGTFLGFLPWNFYPQKIMPGYGGKTLAGLFLSVLAILSFGKVGTALLVLGIPTLDALFTLLRRLFSGKSPVWADRGHLHHTLLDLGWGKRKIALFYWGVSAILGLLALNISSRQKLFTFILISVLFGGFLLWVKFSSLYLNQHDRDNG